MMHQPRRRAFTIVELLVVVGIIALLMGLLLPALAGARRRAQKTEELNHLRSISHAWTVYANFNKDSVLPGYLSPEVQGDRSDSSYAASWKVTYKLPDGSPVPHELAGPWVWRLMPYLDYEHAPIHFYLREDNSSALSVIDEAEELAEAPAFGYNAYYVGGWWEMANVGGGQTRPRARFSNATLPSTDTRVAVVARSIGSIRRSTDVAIFCSSAFRNEGLQKSADDFIEGAHYVTPPVLANEPVWRRATAGGADVIQVEDPTEPVPIGRYTRAAAVLYADGHVDSQTMAGLENQRTWIDAADTKDFVHSP